MNRPAPWRSIMGSVIDRRPFKVGGAMVDPVSRDASWRGGKERLQPQTLKVLTVLVSRRGDVVTRDELVQLCWDGRAVSDDVINRAVLLLRHLAEHAGGFEIETVPRAGYRLIEVEAVRRVKRRWIGAAAAAAAAASVAAIIFLNSRSLPAQQPTLTVFIAPFVAESSDAASLKVASDAHDSAVRMLTESGLSVETASGGPAPDLEISARLQVQPEGASADIKIDDPVRHATLFVRTLQTDAAHARDLPDRVGANLAAPLSWTAPLIKLDQRNPVDPAFLTDLFHGPTDAGFNLMRSYAFARRNAPQAPNSVMAQMGLAMDTGFVFDEIPRHDRPMALAVGRTAALRARQLAPEFGDTVIPWCLLHSPVYIAKCEDRLRSGLRDSDAPFVATFLADLLADAGRTDEALDVATDSLAQDQYVPAKIARLIALLEAAGRTGEAAQRYREGRRLWPGAFFGERKWGMIERGDFDALQRFEQQPDSIRQMGKGAVVAPLAEAVRARSLSRAKAACPANADEGRAVECMIGLARLGDLDDAFAMTGRLFPTRKGRSPAEEERLWIDSPDSTDTRVLTLPATAAMRRDPRFLPLADRLGLLDYWRTGRLPDFCTKAHEPVCARIAAK